LSNVIMPAHISRPTTIDSRPLAGNYVDDVMARLQTIVDALGTVGRVASFSSLSNGLVTRHLLTPLLG
jgi:hypothetical protein